MKAALRWALALGVTGFACGFFGPIVLVPEANQGPLLGIFVTGPAGALAGLVLGALVSVLPMTNSARQAALIASCVVVALITLWYCLPEPATRGYVLDTDVADCIAPAALQDAALADWDQRIAKVTWATPRAGWKQQAGRLFARPDGVVLDLDVRARRAVHEHRKPWDAGRITVDLIADAQPINRVFVRYAGASCDAYALGPTTLFYSAGGDPQPGPWPADDLPGLLGLVVAEPPPADYLGARPSG